MRARRIKLKFLVAGTTKGGEGFRARPKFFDFATFGIKKLEPSKRGNHKKIVELIAEVIKETSSSRLCVQIKDNQSGILFEFQF